MTKKDLDCLKRYLDFKVAHCNISDIQAQDIYDMMHLNCLIEHINEEELDRLAYQECPYFSDDRGREIDVWCEGFKACYHKLAE